jgi:carbon-monoxide dehydrogenase large subunit
VGGGFGAYRGAGRPEAGDTLQLGIGTGGSRSLQLGGAAVQQATRELLDVARGRAAATLEVSAADLAYDPAARAFSVKGDPDATVPLARLAEAERLLVHSVFTAPGPTFPFGSHVAVVEVDTETGKVFLRRVVSVDDAGTLDMATPTTYNPLGAKGIGEAGTIGAAPAVQNAVIDAVSHLGVRHIDMPTSPQRVWRAINAAKGI